jgi:hypothetical protein
VKRKRSRVVPMVSFVTAAVEPSIITATSSIRLYRLLLCRHYTYKKIKHIQFTIKYET